MANKGIRKAAIVIGLVGFSVPLGLLFVDWGGIVRRVMSGSRADAAVGGGNSQFAFDSYAQLQPGDKNLFFSPLSLSLVLAQTSAGAGGNTAKEMRDVLHLDFEPARLHAAMRTLIDELTASGGGAGGELSIANALWVERTCGLLPGFAAIGKDYYGSPPKAVDFKGAPGDQRKVINDWVEERTHGNIKDLFGEGVVDAESRLVLVDAVYFKGAWETPFSSRATKDAPFKLLDGKSVDVPLMGRAAKFKYHKEGQIQVLEMPYAGGSLSMVVLLPDEVGGLAALEKELSARNLEKWMRAIEEQDVVVYFPRFTMTTAYRLDAVLCAMGMKDAFSRQAADFSGISGNCPLYIDAVLHKAFVEVNEKGTEAAAATGEQAKCKEEPRRRPPVFRADHPFVFLIRDMRSGSILFLGRVMNPKAGGE